MDSAAHGRLPEGLSLEPPERLARTVAAWEGEPGRAWLAALPATGRADTWSAGG